MKGGKAAIMRQLRVRGRGDRLAGRRVAADSPRLGRAARALQRLGPHRPRRREQEALAEAHVVVEQIDHHALAFDALGDQIDAGARQQVGEIAGVDVALRAGGAG